ncbi:MAG: ComEA family DNA-binding protein [Thermomicrobiales bacterium]
MKEFVRFAAVFACLATLAVFAFVLLRDRFQPIEIEIQGVDDRPIIVAIDGEVSVPGIYELPVNARLNDLVNAAGGLTPNADVGSLNLAARIGDGETIRISSRLLATPQDENLDAGPLININTANAAELDELPGIGEVLAARIIEHREQFGPFASVDQLLEVEGISESTVEELRPLVTTGG